MWVRYLFLVFLYGFAYSHVSQVSQSVIRTGIEGFVQNGTFSDVFRSYLRQFEMKHSFRKFSPKVARDEVTCILCNALVEELLVLYRVGLIPDGLFAELITAFCIDLEIESPAVCTGVINIHAPTFFYIINNKPTFHAEQFCGMYLQGYGCQGYFDNWSVNIPPGNSPDIQKGQISDLPPLNVVQLTDIHYDPLYAPGSNAVCGEPLCCQVNGPPAPNPDSAAGYWGDYRDCDAPFHAVTEAIEHIAQNHPEIDYVYFTGDIIQHLVWGTTRETNIRDNELIYRLLRSGFPNVPVYPAIGNHEPHPVNLFSPPSVTNEQVTTQWLFDLAADIWGEWLGDEARETIRNGGYYSVLVRPGFRIISLNNNLGYIGNFWLMYDYVDPYGQLQWLTNTLFEAESNGEIVHILSHIPSHSSSLFSIWHREYRRILERFANTIGAAFNGDSHQDQLFIVHNSSNPTQPIHVSWNGGSISPGGNNNPNYKMYTVDSEHYEVIDFSTWIYNLTEANLTPDERPRWYKLYSFKEAYGMDGATPANIRNLAERMVVDRSLVQQYARFLRRESWPSVANGCDDECLRSQICNILVGERGDYTQCSEILANW